MNWTTAITTTVALALGATGGWFFTRGEVVPPLTAVVEISEGHVAPGDYYKMIDDTDSTEVGLYKQWTDPDDSTRQKMLGVWYMDKAVLMHTPTHYIYVSMEDSAGANTDIWLGRNPSYMLIPDVIVDWYMVDATGDTIYGGTIGRDVPCVNCIQVVHGNEWPLPEERNAAPCDPSGWQEPRLRQGAGGLCGVWLIDNATFGPEQGAVFEADADCMSRATQIVQLDVTLWEDGRVWAEKSCNPVELPWLFVRDANGSIIARKAVP